MSFFLSENILHFFFEVKTFFNGMDDKIIVMKIYYWCEPTSV